MQNEIEHLPPAQPLDQECECWSWKKMNGKWTCEHCGSTTSFAESDCGFSDDDNDSDIDGYHDHCSEVAFYSNRHQFDGE